RSSAASSRSRRARSALQRRSEHARPLYHWSQPALPRSWPGSPAGTWGRRSERASSQERPRWRSTRWEPQRLRSRKQQAQPRVDCSTWQGTRWSDAVRPWRVAKSAGLLGRIRLEFYVITQMGGFPPYYVEGGEPEWLPKTPLAGKYGEYVYG